jgi:DNA-binding NarL/FixJ family response regulator
MKPIRVLLVDDQALFREGLHTLLSVHADLDVVGEAGNGSEALQRAKTVHPDVVLMDLRMPGMDGVEATRAIVASHPGARIVALTSYEGDADIYRALEAGASGYLLKDMLGKEVIRAVRAVMVGERVIPPEVAGRIAEFTPRVELTERELEVLALAAKGLRNRDIARAIGRTEATVKVHLKHAMAKLSAQDRTEAVTIALQRGIIHL